MWYSYEDYKYMLWFFMSSYSEKKSLSAILEGGDFSQLEEYKSPSSWPTDIEGRKTLVHLFLKAGEQKLRAGTDADTLFERASQVAGGSADVFFRQGVIFEKNESSLAMLKKAQERYQKALDVDGAFFDALVGLGRTHAKSGAITGDVERFSEAAAVYASADVVAADNIMFQGLLSWQRALLAYWEGNASGEVSDYHRALQHYSEGRECGCNIPEFWTGYATLLMKMGATLRREDLYEEAIRYYNKAVDLDPKYFGGWLAMGNALMNLYSNKVSEKLFADAHEAFAMASTIEAHNYHLLLNWARLITMSGIAHYDSQRVRMGLPKFADAQRLNAEDPALYRYWGEALIAQGRLLETLNFLRQAENTIAKGIELAPEDVILWYHYGACYNEYGKYFDDERYCLQAIEKFNAGLVFDEDSSLLYYGLGVSYSTLAEMRLDDTLIKKSCQCFAKAYDGGERAPIFFSSWGLTLMNYGEMMNDHNAIVDAIGKFENAIANTPEEAPDPELYYHYGCSLDLLGDFTANEEHYERAIEALTYTLQLDPGNNDACYSLGLALSHLGTLVSDVDALSKALALFENAVGGDNEDDMAWNEWGMTLLYISQMLQDPAQQNETQQYTEGAEEKLLRAVFLGNIPALYNLAALYSLTNNTDAAIHYLRRSYESRAMPPLDDILNDDWLQNLRNTPDFQDFVKGFRTP
ncbi:MAG: tetratricopeptide repeat protein [Waddliaceae bacterium]|jgi:tetratricopeptide (TPR) repeat protein|nr:tetratricopeptide repeat protein [Waddliaceae bacterium]MBT6929166.1 tetratricopeptide repeat protein [Waddliaceae bacterium]